MNILSPLVDESDQVELKSQLEGVTGQYDSLRFDSELYPVERWVEDRTKKLAVMCPTGVTVPSLQVSNYRLWLCTYMYAIMYPVNYV